METSLAVVLLTCGGLLLQTFPHLRKTDLGIRSEKLLTFETPLFRYKEFDRRVAFVNAELGVRASYTVTFGGTALVLGAVAMVGSLIPAWRAARVDPVTALRQE